MVNVELTVGILDLMLIEAQNLVGTASTGTERDEYGAILALYKRTREHVVSGDMETARETFGQAQDRVVRALRSAAAS